MRANINKHTTNTVFRQGDIIEFEFDGKSIIGIYIEYSRGAYTVIILEHPSLVPGTKILYTRMDNPRLFRGTITLSND